MNGCADLLGIQDVAVAPYYSSMMLHIIRSSGPLKLGPSPGALGHHLGLTTDRLCVTDGRSVNTSQATYQAQVSSTSSHVENRDLRKGGRADLPVRFRYDISHCIPTFGIYTAVFYLRGPSNATIAWLYGGVAWETDSTRT
jgi:hypothetical protein